MADVSKSDRSRRLTAAAAAKGAPPPPPGSGDERKSPPVEARGPDDETDNPMPPPAPVSDEDDGQQDEPVSVDEGSTNWVATETPTKSDEGETYHNDGTTSGGGGGSKSPQVILVDGVPILSLSLEELETAMEARSVECDGTLDDKREALKNYELSKQAGISTSDNTGNDAGEAAKTRAYPTELPSAGNGEDDEILLSGVLQKKATSGKFFSSLALPQKRYFVLVARLDRETNEPQVVLS